MKKINLLFYGDSPTKNTGFGIVAKNILAQLYSTGNYNITIVGINYFGDPHDFPYKIYPAGINKQNDIYGRQKFLDLLRNKDNKFDIVFTLQDTFIMASIGKAIKELRDGVILEKEGKKVFQKGRNFKWIYYYPIDSVPEGDWIEKTVKYANVAVPYTYYGKSKSQQVVSRKYKVIYHGVDTEKFYPMKEKEKQEFSNKFFKDNKLDKHFLIVNVNRNQERKAFVYTLLAFKIFHSIVPNSVLYTHCDVKNDRGGDLLRVASRLKINKNWLYPNPNLYKKGYSFPTEYMNGIYNLANLNISTTLGEGWGLSCSEAMATKTLNVFPDNTSLTEILAQKRGLLYKSGNPLTQVIMNGPLDNSIIRPMPNVDDLVSKMLWAYSHPDATKEYIDNAYKWTTENITWEIIGKKWDKLIKNTL